MDDGPFSLATDNADVFRLLFENIQDYAIFMMTPEGIVTTWNPGAEMRKGYKADEILGHCFSLFFLPSDIEAGKPHMLLSHAAQAGRVTDEGWRVRKKSTKQLCAPIHNCTC